MGISSRGVLRLCLVSISLVLHSAAGSSVHAAARTWIGGNVDWIDGSSTLNWNPADEPDADDEAIFNTANSVNLGSNNAVNGLTLSNGIDLNSNGFDLAVDGLIQVTGASTNLFIGDGTSEVDADYVTVNSEGTVELTGGALVVDDDGILANDSDGRDFLIWQRQFGSAPLVAAVPELVSLILCGSLVIALLISPARKSYKQTMLLAKVIPGGKRIVILSCQSSPRIRSERKTHYCFSVIAVPFIFFLQIAGATNYHFTNIADTSGPFFSFNNPAINADGKVTFRADLDTTFSDVIYLAHDGMLTLVATTISSQFHAFAFQTPGIDADGKVFFSANPTIAAGAGNGIFSGSGGTIDTYALNSSPPGVVTLGRPSVSPNGQLAFRGSHVEVLAGPIESGVFLGLTPLASSSGPFQDFGNGNAEIAINDSGVVAFTGSLDSGVSGVFVNAAGGGSVVAIADTTDQFNNFVHSSPSINAAGTVAFHASLDVGGEGIFVGSAGGSTTTLIDNSGPFNSFSPVASINSSGAVAFAAQLKHTPLGGNGLFIGPDPVADKVINFGDPLFGSTAGNLFISNVAMNDAGQIAFRYTLANGVNGIAVATPMPSTLLGDFDLDGDIDGRDFLVWQRGGSPNGINSGDLALWQSQYGSSLPVVANSTAVPEPAALVLLLAGVLLMRVHKY